MGLKSILFLATAAAIAGMLVYGNTDPIGVRVGERAPDFAVQNEADGALHLSDLRGNLVFLNFWASWCAPCVDEMPDMELIARAFKDRKFRMLAISADTSDATANEFVKQHGLTLPVYVDGPGRVSSQYGVFAFPETFIIDGSGHVLKHYIGERRWTMPEEMRSLDAMIRQVEEQ